MAKNLPKYALSIVSIDGKYTQLIQKIQTLKKFTYNDLNLNRKEAEKFLFSLKKLSIIKTIKDKKDKRKIHFIFNEDSLSDNCAYVLLRRKILIVQKTRLLK